MKPRKWEDTFGDSDAEKPIYDRPPTGFWTWITKTFEPEAFVNFWLCIFFALVAVYMFVG